MTDITSKLERIALVAEVANHYVDDMRVMPAAGVADTIREAMAQLESNLKDRTECCLQSLASMGQAAEAYAAQLRAEAERDQWIKHAKNAVWSDSEELKLAEAERDALRARMDAVAGSYESAHRAVTGASGRNPDNYDGNNLKIARAIRAALT